MGAGRSNRFGWLSCGSKTLASLGWKEWCKKLYQLYQPRMDAFGGGENGLSRGHELKLNQKENAASQTGRLKVASMQKQGTEGEVRDVRR